MNTEEPILENYIYPQQVLMYKIATQVVAVLAMWFIQTVWMSMFA